MKPGGEVVPTPGARRGDGNIVGCDFSERELVFFRLWAVNRVYARRQGASGEKSRHDARDGKGDRERWTVGAKRKGTYIIIAVSFSRLGVAEIHRSFVVCEF